MTFWKRLGKEPGHNDYLKFLYENPDSLIEIEFYNRTDKVKTLWIEPSCEEIFLESHTEFKIVSHDKFLRFEYDSDGFIILYLQYSFGFKLFKRKHSSDLQNKAEWELVFDNTDIN
ncbi:hypothetical protein [Adhaeribacter rhizoryzae]|uniref:Uncharacterized protein n=1 Tax=Adhaeribacter rhizoryzae TaxID=2607907 RepID=A0A5M6D427_9BACT|nr:hypothetical protein [Adhaeribacter rhizoryzae]KAA5541616.1 hypothetical protein F0145_20610 [Adhaeribacter rhizoryzae]